MELAYGLPNERNQQWQTDTKCRLVVVAALSSIIPGVPEYVVIRYNQSHNYDTSR